MILNSKQLEELESTHDSVVEFEEDATTTENDNFDEGTDSTLAWRRGMIEKAAASVKKAHKKALDPQAPYTLGSLVFDRASKRFARVEASAPGSLQVIYLSGGATSIRQNQNHIAFEEISEGNAAAPVAKSKSKAAAPKKTTTQTKPKNQATVKKTVPEIREIKAVKKPVAVKTVAIKPVTKPTQKSVAKPAAKATAAAATKPTLKTVIKTKAPQKTVKPALKKIGKAIPAKKKPLLKSHKPATKPAQKTSKQKTSAHTPHFAISDPVADPNGYIKQHFRLMSNKELASVTGLSEHTIRRKLGEWGLKRPGKAK